jgi:hypothetical protein
VCGFSLVSLLGAVPANRELRSIAHAEDSAPPALDLRPVTAARSSTLNVAQREAALDGGAPRDLSEGIEGLVRASRATTGEKATRAVEQAVWRVLRPWQKAGSSRPVRYWYIGRTIDAVLCDDGSVEIRDKAGLLLTPSSYQKINQSQLGSSEPGSKAFGSPSGVGIGVGVSDPGRVANRLATGKPQDNAEARKLLSDTLSLRDHLRLEHAREQVQLALRRLRAALDKIWSAAGSLEAKQERTFALWEQCAEDTSGEEARSQIEAFLRGQQQSGHCLYDSAHLARLNARRTGKRAFAPCVVSPPSPAR